MKIHASAPKFLKGLGLFVAMKATGTHAQVTLSEITGHATESDCWTAVYGEAYDVTDFAPNHPAGAAILVSSMCGKDSTTSFDQFHGDNPGYLTMFPGIVSLGQLVAETPVPVPATPAPVPVTPAPVPVTPAPVPVTPAPVPIATFVPVSNMTAPNATAVPNPGVISSAFEATSPTQTPLTGANGATVTNVVVIPSNGPPGGSPPAPIASAPNGPVCKDSDDCDSDSSDDDRKKLLRG